MQRRYPQLCMHRSIDPGAFGGLPADSEDWIQACVSVSVCNKCMQAGKVLFRKVQTGLRMIE